MKKGARFSNDRVYRYSLWRTWDEDESRLMFIGLNPSTADENEDDPTIRRCIGFARRMGYGGIYMLNICAFRSTDPCGLKAAIDPVGPENMEMIMMYASAAGRVIAAWGNHGWLRGRKILDILSNHNIDVWCFGKTKEGCPRHPLYLKADTQIEIFRASRILGDAT